MPVEKFMLHPDSGKFLVTDNGFAVHDDCCWAKYKLVSCAGTFGADRCPRCVSGLYVYYTDTDLSAYVGNVIEFAEDVETWPCYTVYENTDHELPDGDVTVLGCWLTCEACCDDDPTEC